MSKLMSVSGSVSKLMSALPLCPTQCINLEDAILMSRAFIYRIKSESGSAGLWPSLVGRAHCSLRVFFFAYFTVHTAPDHSDPAITWLAPRLHPGPSLASGSALRVPSRKLAGRPRVRVDLQLSSSIERASAFGSAPREARRVD